MNPIADDILVHYGVKRRSGRYPWGSGETPFQRSGDFYSRVQELKKQGLSEADIAKAVGCQSTTELRNAYRVAKNERRQLLVDRANSLRSDGLNDSQIAKEMGVNESTVRSWFNEKSAERMNQGRATADILKKELAEKGMIDVGAGVELEAGVSRQKFEEALTILRTEGYEVHGVGVSQVTNPNQQTTMMVLCEPGTTHKDVYDNIDNIKSFGNYYSDDGGQTFKQLQYPASIDSKRVKIRYAEDGGIEKDGVIEIRRGVDDLSLGNSHYAQVRILVDGTHYLKGMAMYSDDMPDGVDIMFNTNKTADTAKMDVLKKIKSDPDNPFGAAIKANGQSTYLDKDGNEKLSAINKLKEEGDWDTMSRNLSSQFLSKQPIALIKKQLDLTYADAEAEYDTICSLTNPTIKRKMLQDFADECDSATVHLKAAALPRQKTQVILPVSDLKETEIYAPNYKNGEKVVLIRYPHGGTFEIPELTVNNKNKSARKILGENITDAVGINSKVAERLSGADFDGDTVTVIPVNDKVRIKTTRPLDQLKNFDAKTQYAYREGMKVMTKDETQKQMGIVSNLITDMTLRGAPEADIARAVKHSMVVIDAEKHKLDYKRSEKENGIAELKTKWQKREDDDGNVKVGGASTLISRKKQDVRIPERKGAARINPKTGEYEYKESGRTYVDKKTGKVVPATTTVKLMSVTKDAHTLSSGHPIESAYADYANKMKSLGNRARKESIATGKLKYDSNAAKIYKDEVASIDRKLRVAQMNAPRERQAQIIANSVVKAKQRDNPDMDKKELKKVRQTAVTTARNKVNASGKETRIIITDKEWDAIQAGAISDSKLTNVLRYAKDGEVTKRALPKQTKQLSNAQVNRIKKYSASGYTNAEIAEIMNISTSSVSNYIKE